MGAREWDMVVIPLTGCDGGRENGMAKVNNLPQKLPNYYSTDSPTTHLPRLLYHEDVEHLPVLVHLGPDVNLDDFGG